MTTKTPYVDGHALSTAIGVYCTGDEIDIDVASTMTKEDVTEYLENNICSAHENSPVEELIELIYADVYHATKQTRSAVITITADDIRGCITGNEYNISTDEIDKVLRKIEKVCLVDGLSWDGINTMIEDTVAERKEYVCACGHYEHIEKVDDAYNVQCSDGVIDVCDKCIEKSNPLIIINVTDTDNATTNPYKDYLSDWVFLGTIVELTEYCNTLNDICPRD